MIVVAAAWALVGCGDSEPLVLPPRETSVSVPDTSRPLTTTVGGTGVVPATVSSAPTASWVPATGNLAGLPSECGNMSYVSSHPTRDELIAGVAQQGLWVSADGAAEWSQLGQGAGSAVITNRTSSIVYDPDDPDRFWESGIYNAGGVYETVDGGQTFTQLGDVTHSDRVSVDLSDPQRRTLLSGTHERPTVFRSGDAGATWQDVSGDLSADVGMAIAPLVIDDQVHLLGTKGGTAAGIFRTTDGGTTWERVFESGVSSPPLVSPSDGAIYWLKEGGGSMLKSEDDGETWSEIPGRISGGATGLVELPDGRFVTLSDEFLIMSADRGTTWNPFGALLPYESLPNGFTYSPSRKAFYVWRFDCIGDSDNPVADDAIMQLDFDYETG